MKKDLALVVALVTFSLPATALGRDAIGADGERFSIYGWRDDGGVEHYTNELADVPDADRTRVATVIKDWLLPEPPPQDAVCSPSDNTAQTTPASAAPVSAVPELPRNDVSQNVDARQNTSVVEESPLVTQQPVLFDDFFPAGGSASLRRGAPPAADTFLAAGPPPQGAAGPPPSGAAGPPPFGAAGHSPIGFATGRR